MDDPPLTPERRRHLLDEGLACFQRGEFYEAHESWEEVWLQLDDPEHRWLQGLIQVATGCHKLVGGHDAPAGRLLGRALDKLQDTPADWEALPVEPMRRLARELAAGIARGELPDPRRALPVG